VSVEWAGCPDHEIHIKNTGFVFIGWAGCPDNWDWHKIMGYMSIGWAVCPDHVTVIKTPFLPSQSALRNIKMKFNMYQCIENP